MASTAAYSGLRWGELTALTIPQVDQASRVITVDRQVIEVAGHLYVEAPKCRKYRKTIYPRLTPDGYPLAGKLAARIEQATAEQKAGTNPLGLIFPSPTGRHWRSSNFNRNVLKRAYLAIGWRDMHGHASIRWRSRLLDAVAAASPPRCALYRSTFLRIVLLKVGEVARGEAALSRTRPGMPVWLADPGWRDRAGNRGKR